MARRYVGLSKGTCTRAISVLAFTDRHIIVELDDTAL